MPTIQGIDVSRYQGDINWTKVKAAGIKFAMIRIGWAGWEGEISVDAKFKQYVEGATASGVDVGVYVFAYCKTAQAAKIAARQTLEIIKPYQVTYPVAFDMETEAETPYQNYTRAQNTAIADAFLSVISDAKYYAMLYSYKSFLEYNLDMASLKAYDVWVAQTGTQCTYVGSYGMWQYSWVGKIDGISVAVDLDYAYKDYAAIIKAAGLNGWNAKPVVPPDDELPTYYTVMEENKKLRERVAFLESKMKSIAELALAKE